MKRGFPGHKFQTVSQNDANNSVVRTTRIQFPNGAQSIFPLVEERKLEIKLQSFEEEPQHNAGMSFKVKAGR